MCTALYDAANGFLQRHFVEAALSEEFLALRAEEVLELMGCNELNVKAEEQVRPPLAQRRRSLAHLCTHRPTLPVQVFEAALAWVHHDRDRRKTLLPELLAKIRLPLCQPRFLSDRVQQDELIRCCHRCR